MIESLLEQLPLIKSLSHKSIKNRYVKLEICSKILERATNLMLYLTFSVLSLSNMYPNHDHEPWVQALGWTWDHFRQTDRADQFILHANPDGLQFTWEQGPGLINPWLHVLFSSVLEVSSGAFDHRWRISAQQHSRKMLLERSCLSLKSSGQTQTSH